jgi:hypothetical protein
MPRRLYMRCPDCRDSEPGGWCEACNGVGFVPTGLSKDHLEELLRMSRTLRQISESFVQLVVERRPSLPGRRNETDVRVLLTTPRPNPATDPVLPG